MNILLVNNDSDTWEELQRVVNAAGHKVTTVHHEQIHNVHSERYDLAILSGGWWYTDYVDLLNEYADELQFIMMNPIPILGICIGMQLMHVALNQAVPVMDDPQSGLREISVNDAGRELTGFPARMTVHKNHTRAIYETDPHFEILATSDHNFTEMMRHRSKPLLGVQFHPEVGETQDCVKVMKSLIDALLSMKKTS